MKKFLHRIGPLTALVLIFALLLGSAAGAPPPEAPADAYVCRLPREVTHAPGLRPVPYAPGYWTASSAEALAPWREAGLVEGVWENELLTLPEPEPLPDTGPEKQWYLEALHAREAHSLGFTGEGVRVGLIDSGLNASHEAFRGALVSGTNVLPDQPPEDLTDTTGHGTLAAGILCAQGDGAAVAAGLVPRAELLSVRCFSGKNTSVAHVLSAIGYALDAGAQVLNLSIGGTSSSIRALEPRLRQARDEGVLLIAAVGNLGSQALCYPAAFPCVTGVGAVDRQGTVCSFSQQNSSVCITAPGRDIYGPAISGPRSYQTQDGTSFAAPMITALAVMAKEADPDISQEAFETLLRLSARDAGAPGPDPAYGWGVADAGAFGALLASPQPLTYYPAGGTLPAQAPASYLIGSRLPLPRPHRPHCTFRGWFLDEACTRGPVTAVPGGTVGPLSLYAAWEESPVDYQVTGVSLRGLDAALEGGTWVLRTPGDWDLSQVLPEEFILTCPDDRAVPTGLRPLRAAPEEALWSFSCGNVNHMIRLLRAPGPCWALVSGEPVPCRPEAEGLLLLPEPEQEALFEGPGPVSVDLRPAEAHSLLLTPLLRNAPGLKLFFPAGTLTLSRPWLEALTAQAPALSLLQEGDCRTLTLDGRENLPGPVVLTLPPSGSLVPRLQGKPVVFRQGPDALLVRLPQGGRLCLSSEAPPLFRDVEPGDWFAPSVAWAAGTGLLVGVGEERFAPQTPVTRAMLVTVLHRMEGAPSPRGPMPFRDVAPGQWYTEAVAWAAGEGLVLGVTPERFDPGSPVTREQTMAVFLRYARKTGARMTPTGTGPQRFTDWDTLSPYAREAADILTSLHIFTGFQSRLSPRSPTTRAHLSAILERFTQQIFFQ